MSNGIQTFRRFFTLLLILSVLSSYMLSHLLRPRSLPTTSSMRLAQMAAHLSSTSSSNGLPNNSTPNSTPNSTAGHTLTTLPKSCTFTQKLPPDPLLPNPLSSHNTPREKLGPRLVKNALYTFVRPETQGEPELLAVSPRAMGDLGLREGEENEEGFREVVAGNRLVGWDEESGEGVYPWAQCYGGWQFGSWAGQLGDGRAISLFEITNPATDHRYELQLKGAGRTPYSRFADGKAVLRSSIREFVVSEALNALRIPSTRALALTLIPNDKVRRERLEPRAIVARFAESWIRIGTFDLPRSRGDRQLIRRLATYVAEDVYGGWDKLSTVAKSPNATSSPADGTDENRFATLYRAIVCRNALTVAAWQAYGFMNGVLNTDNTSILGLSIDFGPFAFMDNFDPNYTPNHDDHMLRYSYRQQPSVIWWNLLRLGESLGELMGAGKEMVDAEEFVEKGVREEDAAGLVKRAEDVIDRAAEEYKSTFLAEYNRLMTLRLGLKTSAATDFTHLFSELLDTMEALELDFNHFFRKLSEVKVAEVSNEEQRMEVAGRFFHREGVTGAGNTEEGARKRVGEWLRGWRQRVIEDWDEKDGSDEEREKSMKAVNPKFIPRSWVLDELIQRVERGGERDVLNRVMNMALHPFEEEWGADREEEERFCGDVPRLGRAMQCSCSS